MNRLVCAVLSLTLLLSGLTVAHGVGGAKIVRREGTFAVADGQGNLLTDYKYWNAHEFAHGYAAVQNDRQEWGYVDETGKEVVPCRYYSGDVDDFGPDGLAVAGRPGAYQIVDTTGRELLKTTSSHKPWRAGFDLIGYTQGERLGYINTRGDVVVQPQYVYYTDPKGFLRGGVFGENGVAQVYTDWGLEPIGIDTTGRVVEGEAPVLVPLPEHLSIAWVESDNLLSPLGEHHLVEEYHILSSSGMMGYSTTGDSGLRTANGALIVPVAYGTTQPGGPMGAARFAVTVAAAEDGKTLYTDYLGQPFTQDDLNQPWNPPELDVYRVTGGPNNTLEEGNCGYGNPWTGERVLPAIYDQASPFAEGIGLVRIGEDHFAIDREGNRLFDWNAYIQTSEWFSEGLLPVMERGSGKWGALDKTGTLVIPAQWDFLGDFHEGLAVVRQGTGCGYIDRDGTLLVPCVLEEAATMKSGLAIIKHQGNQGILKSPLDAPRISRWAAQELVDAQAAGYITPRCETYQTYEITRLQFAELVVNYLEKTAGKTLEPAKVDTFTDTEDAAVLKAYAAGIVAGVGEGRFAPEHLLTRQELAVMLHRTLGKAGVIPTGEPADLSVYLDKTQVAPWAEEALSALVGQEIFQGTQNQRLAPLAPCTVEQAIVLVFRAAQ